MNKNIRTITILKVLFKRPLVFIGNIFTRITQITAKGIMQKLFKLLGLIAFLSLGMYLFFDISIYNYFSSKLILIFPFLAKGIIYLEYLINKLAIWLDKPIPFPSNTPAAVRETLLDVYNKTINDNTLSRRAKIRKLDEVIKLLEETKNNAPDLTNIGSKNTLNNLTVADNKSYFSSVKDFILDNPKTTAAIITTICVACAVVYYSPETLTAMLGTVSGIFSSPDTEPDPALTKAKAHLRVWTFPLRTLSRLSSAP